MLCEEREGTPRAAWHVSICSPWETPAGAPSWRTFNVFEGCYPGTGLNCLKSNLLLNIDVFIISKIKIKLSGAGVSFEREMSSLSWNKDNSVLEKSSCWQMTSEMKDRASVCPSPCLAKTSQKSQKERVISHTHKKITTFQQLSGE